LNLDSISFFYFFLFLIFFEVLIQIFVNSVKKEFPWLITIDDELPYFDKKKFNKFLNNSFDENLGWVRKPNEKGIEKARSNNVSFSIDKYGSRENIYNTGKAKIAAFGDSYTFCRQVSNEHTWESILAKETKVNVLNYGVGNYGIDQAFMRYESLTLPKEVDIVTLGFVPETIARVHSYWKHYLEFGNIFAFKPRYKLDKGNKIQLIKSPIKSIKDIDNLSSNLGSIQKYDFFYKRKFKKLQFSFPYLFTFLRTPYRNMRLFSGIAIKILFNLFKLRFDIVDNYPFSVIMKDNIKLSHLMYKNSENILLLKKIIEKFVKTAKMKGHTPVILVMPQLYDLKLAKIKKTPYQSFYEELPQSYNVLDLTTTFLKEFSSDLYIEDSYGGHLSKKGNNLVAKTLQEFIKEKKIKIN